jgi:predicted DsbA family dithiol-disulfide isomerase
MSYDAFYWRDELHRYKEDYKKWCESGRKIIKRYRDERKDATNIDIRFNILWSNIKTLKPAVYSKAPNVEVSRRFKDQNDVGRVASMILERTMDYELRQYGDFHSALSNSVEDRLLPGRGVAWIRYEPKIEQQEEPQITDDIENEGAEAGEDSPYGMAGEVEPLEVVTDERTPVDYVFWEDFAHLPARTWEEVTWVARRVFMSKDEGLERFGDKFENVSLTYSREKDPQNDDNNQNVVADDKKAVVWEIWCKPSKKVYWIAEGYEDLLDERDDPLELECFFPCPKPLFSTVTTDSLIPVPDFKLYQDQADEIDEISGRIAHLTKALKVMGVYAADEPSLARLMKEGQDAVLIPVENWPAFMEKGGLGQAIQLVPLADIIATLQQLYQARESCKQIIYETTGLSDILRGASVANETATAQGIKAQFASLRLNDMKDDVARFARDILRMKAEVICSRYQPDIILQVSGIANTPDGQNPELIAAAIQLLKNEPIRNYNIDIETDSMVEIDQQKEKSDRIEFLQASSGFLEKAVQATQVAPEILPLVTQMLLFGVRGFKVGRELEGTFENFQQEAKAKVEQMQANPRPNPQEQEMQAKMQLEQAKAQAEAQKADMDAQIEKYKADLKAQTDMQVAQMRAETDIKLKAMDKSGELVEYDELGRQQASAVIQGVVAENNAALQQNMAGVIQAIQASNEQQTQALASMLAQLTAPKQVIRDTNGKIIGVK